MDQGVDASCYDVLILLEVPGTIEEWVRREGDRCLDKLNKRIVSEAIMLNGSAQHFTLVPVIVALTGSGGIERVREGLL